MKRCLTCNIELQDESDEICAACNKRVEEYRSFYILHDITSLDRINSEIRRINKTYVNNSEESLLKIREPLTRLYALKRLAEQNDSDACKKKAESILKQIQEKKNRNLKAKRNFKAQLY